MCLASRAPAATEVLPATTPPLTPYHALAQPLFESHVMPYTPWSEPTQKTSIWFGVRATTATCVPAAATPPAICDQLDQLLAMSQEAVQTAPFAPTQKTSRCCAERAIETTDAPGPATPPLTPTKFGAHPIPSTPAQMPGEYSTEGVTSQHV